MDTGGHATAIDMSLDDLEKKFKEISKGFNSRFEDYNIKAVEICGFRFNLDVSREIISLSTLSPLMLDHMAREACYYLIKLAMVSEVLMPKCDPTKPRTEA